jgi:hypothetical protein
MADPFQVLQTGDASGSPLGKKDDGGYMRDLLETMWRYRAERFAGNDEVFDRAGPSQLRPPVFRRGFEGHNIVLDPDAPREINDRALAAVPAESRHRWFANMKSTQALVQSVFGNLVARGKLAVLAGLESDDGEPAFFSDAPEDPTARLEQEVTHLGEPKGTCVGLLFSSPVRIAVECKLTEWEVGSCSRPLMEDEDPRYCNGAYQIENGRRHRCPLNDIGVRYWQEIPRLFRWPADQDHRPCPVRFTYQLVRNVLTACIRPDGSVDPAAHALMIYDARNPAFEEKGAATKAWRQTREALAEPAQLRRVSWQRLLAHLAGDAEHEWLVAELNAKYGLAATSPPPTA